MSSEVALLLSAALLITVVSALLSRSMSVTLIMLFYSSLSLGLIFTLYGGVLVGLLHIITFAGAISVMLLTVTLMTGESEMDIGRGRLALILSAVTVLIAAAASYQLFSGPLTGTQEQLPEGLLNFIWLYRPWDLLILIVIFAAAMIAVVNLLSREE